jgi:hypothetical protein
MTALLTSLIAREAVRTTASMCAVTEEVTAASAPVASKVLSAAAYRHMSLTW